MLHADTRSKKAFGTLNGPGEPGLQVEPLANHPGVVVMGKIGNVQQSVEVQPGIGNTVAVIHGKLGQVIIRPVCPEDGRVDGLEIIHGGPGIKMGTRVTGVRITAYIAVIHNVERIAQIIQVPFVRDVIGINMTADMTAKLAFVKPAGLSPAFTANRIVR